MRRVLIAAALIAFAAPAFAQNPKAPVVEYCIGQNGKATPCQFTDLPLRGDVTQPFTPPLASNKAQTVAISPNSGSGSGYPSTATPVTAHNTGTTGAVAATLLAVPGATNYVCGLSVSPGSATSAITLTEVLSGILGGSMTWAVGAPVTAAGTTGATFTQNFNPCIPASAVNTAIAITSSALGTGGTNNDAQIWGYYR